MMKSCGKTHWRLLGALLDSHLALSFPKAQLNLETRFRLEMREVWTPQAQPTVLTRRISLLPTNYQRTAGQI